MRLALLGLAALGIAVASYVKGYRDGELDRPEPQPDRSFIGGTPGWGRR